MKNILLLGFLLITSIQIKAQEIGAILAASEDQLEQLTNEFIRPATEGFMMASSRGWYNSARTHKFLGFDITANIQLSLMQSSDEFFRFRNIDYTSPNSRITLVGSEIEADVPTVVGGTTTERFRIEAETTEDITGTPVRVSETFDFIDGIGEEYPSSLPLAVPAPVVQIGLGLPKKTDLSLRLVPDIGGDDFSFNLFGIGVKHSIDQYIWKDKKNKKKGIKLAVFGSYSNMDVSYNDPLDAEGDDNLSGENMEANINVKSFTFEGIASYKWLLFEPYLAVGYTNASSDYNLDGTYTYTYNDNTLSRPVNVSFTDPVALSYDASTMTSTIGLRLNLSILKVYADYTIGDQNILGAGIAFSVR